MLNMNLCSEHIIFFFIRGRLYTPVGRETYVEGKKDFSQVGVKSKDTLIVGSSEVWLATYLPGACGFPPVFAFCIELPHFAAWA